LMGSEVVLWDVRKPAEVWAKLGGAVSSPLAVGSRSLVRAPGSEVTGVYLDPKLALAVTTHNAEARLTAWHTPTGEILASGPCAPATGAFATPAAAATSSLLAFGTELRGPRGRGHSALMVVGGATAPTRDREKAKNKKRSSDLRAEQTHTPQVNSRQRAGGPRGGRRR